MLRRYQVLLGDWIEDYIKYVIEKYDISSSSVIRIHMALGIIFIRTIINPEYKLNFGNKEFQESANRASRGELDEAEVHKFMSRILFEARKVVESRLAEVAKQKNK
ncbi:MAG: hypothetical protein GTO16_13285 [Candidatus Aminicenantes bacterium]|nr:hypothetical protein [Candidatus Aminicenantes bacterium]